MVDHRERGSAIPDALIAAGLDVRLTDLPVGAGAGALWADPMRALAWRLLTSTRNATRS